MNEFDKNNEWDGEESNPIDWMGIFSYVFSFWPWFIASIVICALAAFFYLKYTPPVYNITATVMIKDAQKGGNATSELSAFENMGLFTTNSNFDNEVEVMKSRSLLKQVVYEMKAYATYTLKDGFNTYDLYGNSPVLVEMTAGDNDLLKGILELDLSFQHDSLLTIAGKYHDGMEITFHGEVKTFPSILETPAGNLSFSRVPGKLPTVGKTIHVALQPAMAIAKSCYGRLSIGPTTKATSVARLTFKDTHKRRGEDFLNKLIEMYNRFTNSDKNLIGQQTEKFINERIAIISGELGDKEKELENFKSQSGLTNLEQVSSGYLRESAEYQQKMTENNIQINLVTSLKDFVENPQNKDVVIPANIGLTDNMLAGLINSYNEQILERKRLMQVSTPSNPEILKRNAQIEGTLSNIKGSIYSVLDGLRITQRDLKIQAGKFTHLISTAPTQERILTDITRQQEIKSGLYLMLLQKREENSMTMAATIDNARVIDPAMADGAPISPKRNTILLAAFILGITIPGIFLYLKHLFMYKVDTSEEVKKLTSMPVLNDIPLSSLKTLIVVKPNENTQMTEAFRDLRTNLQFMLGDSEKKIIMVTSTRPEEGKTFIASNTAISLALLDKKVLVIGLDIRKPRLAESFSLPDQKEGITSYLSGRVKDISSLIIKTEIAPSLFLLPAGQVPPNPAELLASPRLDEALQELKKEYDYIVIDTAPVGVVADTLILGRIADMTLYVCRSAFTHKKEIGSADSLYRERKLKNMCLLVNGVKWQTKRYGNYGNKYGYEYGQYGYENK